MKTSAATSSQLLLDDPYGSRYLFDAHERSEQDMPNELRSAGQFHARSAREVRAFEAVAKRIHDDYPAASVDAIVTLLQRSYARTEDATVQAFRGLLAERDARSELRQPWTQVCGIETLEHERLNR